MGLFNVLKTIVDEKKELNSISSNPSLIDIIEECHKKGQYKSINMNNYKDVLRYEFEDIETKVDLDDVLSICEYLSTNDIVSSLSEKYKPYRKYDSVECANKSIANYQFSLVKLFFETNMIFDEMFKYEFKEFYDSLFQDGFKPIKGYDFTVIRDKDGMQVLENGVKVNPWINYFQNVKNISGKEGLIQRDNHVVTIFNLWINGKVDTKVIISMDRNRILCDEDFYEILSEDTIEQVLSKAEL